jgi:ATP-dependent DNA helicase DinG
VSLSAWFEPQGLLSQRLDGFRSRPSQASLAKAIATAIDHRTLLVAEAGTGIGKTYAYLIPALLSGQKVLVSTASRALQDQLFSRDIPRLLKAMGLTGVSVARLKGRSNYLCPYRLERARQDGRLSSAQEVQDLRQVVQFAALSPEGDISACTTVSEHSMVWPLVTSTVDNCLGQRCPMVTECPVIRAREQAQRSELVIVNHHLLCADLALRREGGGELLPRMDVVVVDEAHALPDTALQFFGLTVSTHGLALLARDALVAGLELARDGADWAGLSGQLEASVLAFRSELAAACAPGKHKWEQLSPRGQDALHAGLMRIGEALVPLHMAFCVNAERHAELVRLQERIEQVQDRLDLLAPHRTPEAGVHWIEVGRQSLSLHWSPLDAAPRLREVWDAPERAAWVFLSATLTVPSPSGSPLGDFAYFCELMGLDDAQCERFESPFDYAHQSLLVVPEQLPDPKQPSLVTQLLEMPGISALIRDATGGIFLLCTSLRAVDQAAQWLGQPRSPASGRMLLIQGSAPRDHLLQRFREDGRAMLVGSASFWEGVDVPGSALSVVIIDKLPFAPPDDPVLESRMNRCRSEGGDPFNRIQLPEATLMLKQGVGRLIRTETDRGLLLVGDRRLAETPYGRRMLRSLPPFRRTRSLDEARAFLLPELESGPDAR